jgi:hypothetical protein
LVFVKRSRLVGSTVATVLVGAGMVALTPATAQAATVTATVVANRSTSGWARPAPDPSGIAYDPSHRRLVISDSEVDEMPLYRGTNVFFASLTGQQQSPVGWTTEPWSYEPAGFSRVNASLSLVSDDDQDKVFLVTTQSSGLPTGGTPAGFTTRPDNGDAEDVTLNATSASNGHIYVIDGTDKAIYNYGPGPNGRFDGVQDPNNPRGDDTRVVYNVGRFGAQDPEGITWWSARNSLLIVDSGSKTIYELDLTGHLLNKISFAAANPKSAAGITIAPASDGSGRTDIYVVDRGVDNNTNPSENDGRFYELRASLPPR